MIANAKKYNREGSMVYRDATILESHIDITLKALSGENNPQPKEEFSAEFCHRVLQTIKNYEDESGRQVAELFLELPNQEDYPDYYKEITKPIAINIIEERINKGTYSKLERFEKDVNLMFDNAKHYNAEGSNVYLDAETLQQLFWKAIGKNGRGRQTKGKRTRKHDYELKEVVHRGQTYRVGDFVHIQNDSDPEKPTIGLISALWQEESGVQGLDAIWFLRPEHIVHPYASRFYSSEVVKAAGVYEHLVNDILERCFVLQTKDYIRGRPVNWQEGQSIYVCEQRYNESYKSVSKIKNWASCFPPGHKPDAVQLKLFPQPMVIKKLPSASMVEKAGKQHTNESTAGSPSSLRESSTYGSSREATPKEDEEPSKNETLKSAKSNKRKSTQLLPGSPPQKVAVTLIEKPELDSQLPLKTRVVPSGQHRFRCNFSNLSTKQQCSASYSSEQELQQHVSSEHANVVSNTQPAPGLKRGRPKKSSDVAPNITSPLPSIQPNETEAQDRNARPQSSYVPYSPTGSIAPPVARPTMPTHTASSQDVNVGSTYSQTPQTQQQTHQRGVAYQQPYDQPLQNEHSRPPDYTQNISYNPVYGYGPQYPVQQHTSHQGYPYSDTQYQQGYASQGYNPHQQNPYAQTYSQPYATPLHGYQQQQHYSQPYSTQPAQQQRERYVPQSSAHGTVDYKSQLALAQQQRLVQQQQLVQQQYLAQQPQAGYHQRSLSQTQSTHPQPHQQHQQQQGQQYPSQSPVSVIASQSYTAFESSYQQQPYLPPTSLAYSTSGHTASLSNASSHGSVSTVTNAMEGVGLGLSGVTNADHGRVIANGSTSMNNVSSMGYTVKGAHAL
ncbi:MAG: hypothetical protein J3Q66DRAFT_162612 [Benniella sp.]|nr:MAG: hypothetical protein J3Q66DRAFT_162612 [Benniella sp.]